MTGPGGRLTVDGARCLVDLDDTLLDYRREERAGAAAAGLVLASGVPALLWSDAYRRAKHTVRRTGGTPDEDDYRRRFALAATAVGTSPDDALLDRAVDRYWAVRHDNVRLLPGARTVLDMLRRRARSVEICTHGLAARQRTRLARAGVADLVDRVRTSEEAGVGKTDWIRFLGPYWRPGDRYVVFSDQLLPDLAAAAAIGMETVLVGAAGPGLPRRGVPGHRMRTLCAVAAAIEPGTGRHEHRGGPA